ncbi:MAG: M20 family metallo-hydrolase [Zestosphaera sp.]
MGNSLGSLDCRDRPGGCINLKRLKESLVESGRFGRNPPVRVENYEDLDLGKGVTRPTGSEADRMVRDYAVRLMEEAGLEVRVDVVGNIFGRLEGAKTRVGAVMTGSHLDSVINGGQFDGALGVFGAIEAVRSLIEEGFINERPIEIVVFTGEEGSAFKPSLLGSSVLVGKLRSEEALSARNDEGVTLEEALDRIGYKGDFVRNLDDVEYMVELHIEQGPVLWREGVSLGVVENITGITWLAATIEGEANHAGTTPMTMRKDALVAAAEIVQLINRRAKEIGPTTVGTVGRLNVHPNGINIIPGRVEMGIDIRDVIQDNMLMFRDEVIEKLKQLEVGYGVKVDVQTLFTHKPAPLSPEVISAVEDAAARVGVRSKRMNSGAGHDSQNMAERVKTGMIFVPSVRGISHSPLEWTDWNDVGTGVQILKETIKLLSTKPHKVTQSTTT